MGRENSSLIDQVEGPIRKNRFSVLNLTMIGAIINSASQNGILPSYSRHRSIGQSNRPNYKFLYLRKCEPCLTMTIVSHAFEANWLLRYRGVGIEIPKKRRASIGMGKLNPEIFYFLLFWGIRTENLWKKPTPKDITLYMCYSYVILHHGLKKCKLFR